MSISGRLLILTAIYIFMIEIVLLIFGMAAFRKQAFNEKIYDAKLVARAILANPEPQIDPEQSTALLQDAKILDLVIKRHDRRERLLLPIQQYEVDFIVDVDAIGYPELILQSLQCLYRNGDEVLLILGKVEGEFESIETLVRDQIFCADQRGAFLNVLPFAFVASLFLGVLIYTTTRIIFVRPIEFFASVVKKFDVSKKDYQLVDIKSGIKEIRQTEGAVRNMQLRVLKSFGERERLATIGESVAKIQHDLRNMLTTAQMVADNLETSTDARVKRSAPRLVRAIDRAVELSAMTLEYGKLGEQKPMMREVALDALINEVLDNERILLKDERVSLVMSCSQGHTCQADPKLLKRVIENITRNARQILEQEGQGGQITIGVTQNQNTQIWIEDTGPGFSDQAREFLFQPFKGSTRQGGTGLGLAICKELCELMGGALVLDKSDDTGTRFKIEL